MTSLELLYAEQRPSPWLDNLSRGDLRDGTLARMVADGIRGVTANPTTIFTKAIVGSADYDEQFAALTAAARPLEDAYWQLVVDDVTAALAVSCPVFDHSGGANNPADPDTRYVDQLIGPDTINTLPEATIAAFNDHRTLARTIDTGVDEAAEVVRRLATAGIDMDDVRLSLKARGVAGFHNSYQQVLTALAAKTYHFSRS